MSHVLELIEVRGHICGQDHLHHQTPQQLVVLTRQTTQEVAAILRAERERESLL